MLVIMFSLHSIYIFAYLLSFSFSFWKKRCELRGKIGRNRIVIRSVSGERGSASSVYDVNFPSDYDQLLFQVI